MTFDEALKIVASGGRVASDSLPQAAVLKKVDGNWRVVFEATDDSYAFILNPYHEAANWRQVTGWSSYG